MKSELSPWPQDAIPRPVMSSTAAEDPLLRTLDKAQFVVPWTLSITNTGGLFSFRYVVDETNNFVISTINAVAFVDATQAVGGMPGFLTVQEDATQNPFIENVSLALLGSNGVGGTTYRRSLWPMPYPIGAGGGFLASLNVPTNTAGNITMFITFDGWKDYTLGNQMSG